MKAKLYVNGELKGTFKGKKIINILNLYAQMRRLHNNNKGYEDYFDLIDDLPKIPPATIIEIREMS